MSELALAASSRAAARDLPRGLLMLMASAAGLAVAATFFAQPMLDQIASDLGLARHQVGVIFAATQLGYGLGLVALVPMGDVLDRRRLIVGHMALCAAMLALLAAAPGVTLFLVGLAAVGALAVVAQQLVAHAAGLSSAASQGRAVGGITVGIIAGVVAARVIGGVVAESFGWRAVFAGAAALTAALAGLLWLALPAQARPSHGSSYPRVVASVFMLLRTDATLRSRAVLAFLVFSAITGLWTPMVLALRSAPYELGHATIGLFGLSGIASAVGAACAGRWADRGHAQSTTGRALVLMLCAWAPISLLPTTIWGLIAGSLMIEVAVQIVHVSNQSLAYRRHPEAKSRLAAAYMLLYALGCATGAMVSTIVYTKMGWSGVSVLGAATTSAALAIWAATRRGEAR